MSNSTISDFYCVVCGGKGMSIPRKVGQQREAGHLKKIYCIYCKKTTNHAEIKPFGSSYTKQDFDLEFETGRFINEEKIPIKNLPPCNKDCYCNINGRCWNSKGNIRQECGFDKRTDILNVNNNRKPDLQYCSDGSIKEVYR